MIPTPSSLRVRTSAKSDATSSSVSELVGSSRTRTRASIESARAISTSCCWSGLSRRTGSDGSTSRPSRRSASKARRRVARQSINGPRRTMRCPRKTFSVIERSGARVVSCVTVAIPLRSASAGSRKSHGRPASDTVARVRLDLPRQDVEQGRLARAVLADERVHFAGKDGDAGAAERVDAPVALVQRRCLQERIRGHRLAAVGQRRPPHRSRRSIRARPAAPASSGCRRRCRSPRGCPDG